MSPIFLQRSPRDPTAASLEPSRRLHGWWRDDHAAVGAPPPSFPNRKPVRLHPATQRGEWLYDAMEPFSACTDQTARGTVHRHEVGEACTNLQPAPERTAVHFLPMAGRSLEVLSFAWASARELVVTRPKLCPECVAEKGFIEAHFDLALMCGCPVHKRSLLSRCPGCMKPLRWFRPGLLECRCGISLRNVSLPVIPGAEADLLDIMRRKTLGLAAGQDYASGLPGSYLEVMSLQPLLSLIGILGRRRMVVDNDSDRRNSQRTVFAAASVLADWPNNFFRLLRGITEGVPTDSSRGVARGRLSGVYRSLLNLRRIMPTEEADFLRIAFLDF